MDPRLRPRRTARHRQDARMEGSRRPGATRIGALADFNLGWQRGSVLNRISEERADASAALVKAARDARVASETRPNNSWEKRWGSSPPLLRSWASTSAPRPRRCWIRIRCRSVAAPSPCTTKAASRFAAWASGPRVCLSLAYSARRPVRRQSCSRTNWSTGWSRTASRVLGLPRSQGGHCSAAGVPHHPLTRGAERTVGRPALRVAPRPLGHEARLVGADNDIQSTIRLYPEAFLAGSVVVCEEPAR